MNRVSWFHQVSCRTWSQNTYRRKQGQSQPIRYASFNVATCRANIMQWHVASRATKWSKEWDEALHRLVSYIQSSLSSTMRGFIGDKFSSGFSQMPISQGHMTLSPPQDHTWYYPTHAFSKKQTAVGMCSKEAEVHSVFTYLLAMSDPNAPAEVRQQKAGVQAKPKAPMPKDRVSISNWSGFGRNSVWSFSTTVQNQKRNSITCNYIWDPAFVYSSWETTKQPLRYIPQ